MTVQHCVACGWTEDLGFLTGFGLAGEHASTARWLLESLFGRRTTCPKCGYMVLLIEVEK